MSNWLFYQIAITGSREEVEDMMRIMSKLDREA